MSVVSVERESCFRENTFFTLYHHFVAVVVVLVREAITNNRWRGIFILCVVPFLRKMLKDRTVCVCILAWWIFENLWLEFCWYWRLVDVGNEKCYTNWQLIFCAASVSMYLNNFHNCRFIWLQIYIFQSVCFILTAKLRLLLLLWHWERGGCPSRPVLNSYMGSDRP